MYTIPRLAGFYNPYKSHGSYYPCPAGTYASSPGSSACTACAVGRFSPEMLGATSCSSNCSLAVLPGAAWCQPGAQHSYARLLCLAFQHRESSIADRIFDFNIYLVNMLVFLLLSFSIQLVVAVPVGSTSQAIGAVVSRQVGRECVNG